MPGVGTKMKLLVEQTRVTFHIGEPNFRPTPNVRNPAMMQEATDFAKVMTSFKHAIRKYSLKLDKFLAAYPVLLNRNLPRAWVAVPEHPGQCEPMRPRLSIQHPTRIGGDFDERMFMDSRIILKDRLEGIVRPVEKWLESLDVVKERMRKLGELQLLMDARRRTIVLKYADTLHTVERLGCKSDFGGQGPSTSSASSAVLRLRGTLRPTSSAGRPRTADVLHDEDGSVHSEAVSRAPSMHHSVYIKGERGLDQPIHIDNDLFIEDHAQEALHQSLKLEGGSPRFLRPSRRLEAATGSFKEQERIVFDHLRGLVLQAPWLKSHMAASLLAVKETLQASMVGLGPCMQPLPNCSNERCNVANFGDLGTCDILAAEVPQQIAEHKAAMRAAQGDAEQVSLPGTPRYVLADETPQEEIAAEEAGQDQPVAS